jgi:pimeloyl-ACP methyl ester carboxylesterase
MLHYETHYKGPEKEWAVFLHGLGGNSNIWYKQVDAFKEHYNLLFVDLFGHGGTNDIVDTYSFEILAEAVIEVMEHLKIESAHLVAISLGSIIADAIGFKAPSRVKSMVLGGAAMGYDFRAKFLLHTGRLLKLLMPYMWLYRLFAFIMMPRTNHSRSRGIFIREARKLGGREFRKWYKLMETLELFYSHYRKSASRIPKLYISGAEDHMFLPFVIRNFLQDRLSSIHIIEKCGHVCNIEKHKDFNRVSLYYLNSYPAAPSLKYVPPESAAGRIPLDHYAVHKMHTI